MAHITPGTLLLYALINASFIRPALLIIIIATGGLGVVRLLDMMLVADYSVLNFGIVGFELAVAGLAIALMTQLVEQ